MKKIKWKPRLFCHSMGVTFYIIEDDTGFAYRLGGEIYTTAYKSEAQEIADKLNEEEK